jgi:hypothetical protein
MAVFPSWSWCSVQGKIKLDASFLRGWEAAEVSTLKSSDDTRLRLPIPLINLYICIKANEGFVPLSALRIADGQEKRAKTWGRTREELTYSLPRVYDSLDQRGISLELEIPFLERKPGRLIFRTQSATFGLQVFTGPRVQELHWQFSVEKCSTKVLSIHLLDIRPVGYIEMSDIWVRENLSNDVEGCKFEFVSLSACGMPRIWVPELFPMEEYLVPTINDTLRSKLLQLQRYQKSWRTNVPWVTAQIKELLYSEDRSNDDNDWDLNSDENFQNDKDDSLGIPCPPMVNVMLIDCNGGVACRFGIGKILLSKWQQAMPQVKTIALD